MAYRKNESDKQINDVERALADSTIVVNIDGETKNVGSPTGAGDDRSVSRCGIVLSHDDKIYVIQSKAGKKRASDSN